MRSPKSHYRQSTPLMAREIRERYFIGRIKQTVLARSFGISQGSVSRIVSGHTWRDA